ncbi:MAG TPA: Crp/Fnr family transcriptional regulator [Candidatus Kapabacteria bacterium]|jgi:CRP/FNR family transcriptional regulator|nr:Crp/Fnr family transcriptional regulator [Candidatus Kapabacteria bacterium]
MSNTSTPTSHCDTCESRERSVFCELLPREIESITATKVTRTISRGDTLFYDGDTPAGIYCVSQGTLKIYKGSRDGREQIVRLARPGDIVGYRAILSGGGHNNSATALDDVSVCYIPRAVFFSLIQDNPQMATKVLSLLSAELRRAEDRMVDMQRPVRERVAETLLLLRQSGGVDADGRTLNIRVTRAEIGSIVGAATESVIRLLADFKREGLVEFVGRRISILDHDRLVDAAALAD